MEATGPAKTCPAKITHAILRKIRADDFGGLGDVSTPAERGLIDDPVRNRRNRA